jgi:chaperonin GroES
MSIKPLADRVLIKPKEGLIVAAGPGRVLDDGTRVPLDVKVGDSVLYAKYAGTEYKIENVEHLIVKETDILAVVG